MESNSFLAIGKETLSPVQAMRLLAKLKIHLKQELKDQIFKRWLQEKLDKVRVEMAESIYRFVCLSSDEFKEGKLIQLSFN